MAKKVEAGGFVSPANLWGKPLPTVLHKSAEEKKKGTTRMRTEDEDEIDLDVDAELEEDGPSEADLISDEEDEESDLPVTASIEETDDDETEEDDDEEVASAVEADTDSEPVAVETPTTTKKRATSPMAEKKSMSDYVRDEITARKASGDSLRGVDIVNALAKKKIKVSPAQVSQLLKKAGVSQKARGKRAAAAAEPTEKSRVAEKSRKVEPKPAAAKVAKAPTGSLSLPIAQLKAAKAFLAACDGSYVDAKNALALHAELGDIL